MKQQKTKQTVAQLQKRIERAIVHIDRTKETQEIFFSDKSLRITVTEDYAIIGSGFHDHLFQSYTMSGVSRPYLYAKRFVELAKENDCTVTDEDGNKQYSYTKLMASLEAKGTDNVDYVLAWYIDQWMYNCFNPLFSIGESEAQAFMVFMDYMHNIAKNNIFLDEHKDGLTNKQFISEYIAKIKEFSKEITETTIFHAKTDEQVIQENIDALQADENERIMQEQLKNKNND